MRTANPALNAKTFEDSRVMATSAESMTIEGTVNKTGTLLLFLILSACLVWYKGRVILTHDASEEALARAAAAMVPWMIGGLIGGLIFGFATVLKRTWAPVTAPVYALLEGLFLGGLSLMFEARMPGLVVQAVGLTMGTLFCLLLAYKTGLIRASEKFKLGVAAATGAICLLYLVTMVLGFFHVNVPHIYGAGPIGIGFSLVVVVIAALNLVLDFDFVEQGARAGAPKYMEWYAAFGLIVTLVWLYIEILRLLSKLRERR
jgi:uncharacterized YccA/Bax inhibitor family protein